MKKIFLCMSLALLCILSCAACGKEEGRTLGVDGYVYVVQNPDQSPETSQEQALSPYGKLYSLIGNGAENFLVSGDSLYFTRKGEGGISVLRVDDLYNAADGPFLSEIVCAPSIQCYTVDAEGSLYYYDSAFNASGGNLYKLDRDGKELFSAAVSVWSKPGSQGSLFDCLAVDGEGRIYLLWGDAVYLFGTDGSQQGNISLEDYVQADPDSSISPRRSLMRDEEGGILCRLLYNGMYGSVLKIWPDGDQKTVPVEGLEDVWAGSDLFMTDSGLLLHDVFSGTLYSCRPEDGKMVRRPLLYWQDSELDASMVNDVAMLPEGELIIQYDISVNNRNGRVLILK